MTSDDLKIADRYDSGHKVRTIRDSCLEFAAGEITLVDALEGAWWEGYNSSQADELRIVYRLVPMMDVTAAKAILRRVPAYAPRCDLPWYWEPMSGGWIPEGDDCTIRPGLDSVIVMEASGEHAGCVVTDDGRVLIFPPGTFR